MAATLKPKQLVLDANVLFDLADGQDFAHALLAELGERGFALFVVPTVVQELVLIYGNIREDPTKRHLAETALRKMRDWKIRPYDLVAVGHGITEQFARRLMNKGLLPPEELNDGLIVAETSLAGIPGLVTSDKHLLNIPPDELLAVLDEKDLDPITVCHPKNLLRTLERRR